MKQHIRKPSDTFQEAYSCPYFADGRTCTIEYILPAEREALEFHTFLARGYRRLGRIFYHNICKDCSDCLPVRIETDMFVISKSQMRTINKNRDIRVEVLHNPQLTTEKVLLYDKYVRTKHDENKEESIDSAVNVLLNMHYGYKGITEMNYYLGDRLVGVGIVDAGLDALSSNYFYYDTDHLDRRPGIFSILKEIEVAQTLGKTYYYLGFYIRENPRMSYKKDFRPCQMLVNGEWTESIKNKNEY